MACVHERTSTVCLHLSWAILIKSLTRWKRAKHVCVRASIFSNIIVYFCRSSKLSSMRTHAHTHSLHACTNVFSLSPTPPVITCIDHVHATRHIIDLNPNMSSLSQQNEINCSSYTAGRWVFYARNVVWFVSQSVSRQSMGNGACANEWTVYIVRENVWKNTHTHNVTRIYYRNNELKNIRNYTETHLRVRWKRIKRARSPCTIYVFICYQQHIYVW